MRLLLDAHVSGRRVGTALKRSGHDVRALDAEPELEGLDDEGVLELSVTDGRVLITHNVADFPAILREWGEGGRRHAGVILIYGIDHREFGLIVRGVERWAERRTDQASWVDFACVVDRSFASA